MKFSAKKARGPEYNALRQATRPASLPLLSPETSTRIGTAGHEELFGAPRQARQFWPYSITSGNPPLPAAKLAQALRAGRCREINSNCRVANGSRSWVSGTLWLGQGPKVGTGKRKTRPLSDERYPSLRLDATTTCKSRPRLSTSMLVKAPLGVSSCRPLCPVERTPSLGKRHDGDLWYLLGEESSPQDRRDSAAHHRA